MEPAVSTRGKACRPSTAGPSTGGGSSGCRLLTPRPPTDRVFFGVLRGAAVTAAATATTSPRKVAIGAEDKSLTHREEAASARRTFQADFHRKVQHVPCAREVQLALRARLLEMEGEAALSSTRRSAMNSALSLKSNRTAAHESPVTDEPFARDESSSDDDDEGGEGGEEGLNSPIPKTTCSRSAAGSRGATAFVAAPSPPPTASNPGRGSAVSSSCSFRQPHGRHHRRPQFSTNFRIDSSWDSKAYVVPNYFETREFKKVIAPRVERLAAPSRSASTERRPVSASLAVAPQLHTRDPLPRDDRVTSTAKDAARCGRHHTPFVIPFPLQNSLRQSDTLAELFVAEQQESRKFREMLQLDLRPAVPESVAQGLFSPRHAKEDEREFVSQDTIHSQQLRVKIGEAVRRQLSLSARSQTCETQSQK